MKLLLINPRLPESFWSFTWAFQNVACDKRAAISPLGLATLAALTPPGWDVPILDENVEPIDWDARADVVGVCGMAVQYPRQREILDHFRQAGCYTVAGGSYASLCPEEYRDAADTVVAGEAEYIWPRFCADFEKGQPLALYRETGTVEMTDSPLPRYDLLKLDKYQSVALQFSRGCPFRCEFCDIIITFGRKPRAKSLSQIERELDLLRERGVRNVFFVDDNLIGHLPRCRELLPMLAEYQRRHRYAFAFGAETSANVATQPDLLPLLRAANFEWVFVGIETPSREALVETKKEQNTRADMLESVRAIYAHGIDVYASFVVGFDADDVTVFDRQYEFIIESGIMVASVALLLALPRTPLHERLERTGRLREMTGEFHHLWNNLIQTNIVPHGMSYDELVSGFRDLIARITSDAAIAARIRNKLPRIGPVPVPFRVTPRAALAAFCRFVLRGLLPGRAAPVVPRRALAGAGVAPPAAVAVRGAELGVRHRHSGVRARTPAEHAGRRERGRTPTHQTIPRRGRSSSLSPCGRGTSKHHSQLTRFVGLHQPTIERLEALRHRRTAVLGLDAPACRGPVPRGAQRVGDQLAERRHHRVGVVRGHDHAALAAVEELRVRAHVGRDHRAPGGHVFQQRVRHAFRVRGQHGHIDTPQEAGYVGHGPAKHEPVAQSEFRVQAFQFRALLAVAGHLEHQLRELLQRGLRGAHQPVDVLHGPQVRDAPHAHLPLRRVRQEEAFEPHRIDAVL